MATTNCPTCGHTFDDTQATSCPNCGAPVTRQAAPPGGGIGAPPPPAGGEPPPPLGGEPPPPTGGGSSVPFEDASQPFFQRLLETAKLSFSDPTRLFSNMPSEDIGPPVLYGVIIGTIAVVFGMLWQILFGGLASVAEGAGMEEFAVSTGLLVFFMIFSPALVLVGLFISSGIYHLMLMLVGGASRGFPVTLRAVCYGYTPNLLAIVPICGGVVGGIWALVLTIMGAVYGHRTDAWRAILAYFLPLIFCCCLGLVLAMMFGFIGAVASN